MAIAIERSAHDDGRWAMVDKRSTLATTEDGQRLGVAVGRPVVRFLRIRQSQGRNDLVEATVVPAGTAARLASSGLAEERLSIVPAPAWVAELLDVPASTPVLKLDRIVRTAAGAPLEWRLTFSPASATPWAGGLRGRLRAQNR